MYINKKLVEHKIKGQFLSRPLIIKLYKSNN